MQVSMVMILALTGLGCENEPAGARDTLPPVFDQGHAAPSTSFPGGGYTPGNLANSFASTPYPGIPSYRYSAPRTVPHDSDWHAELRSTLYSFVFGHDPEVVTIREIEASVYGEYGGH
jgi:hypothetical protein